MNREQLKAILDGLNVPESMYSLADGLPGDGLVMGQDRHTWIVLDQEKGERYNIVHFDTEEEACAEFYQRMISMLSVMSQWSHLRA